MSAIATTADAEALRSEIVHRLDGYGCDHYRLYPATKVEGWKSLLLDRIPLALADPETTVIRSDAGQGTAIVALRAKRWDRDHFGFPVASIEVLFSDGPSAAINDCLAQMMSVCRERKINFASVRVNGDQLDVVHALESAGFRYYENIIWPVVALKDNADSWTELGVRPMNADEVDDVAAIANANQYERGHFHADPWFSKESVNSLYGRWVRTAFQNNQPVIVVENDEKAAGYFVLDLPASLSDALGAKYGGMRSLGLDTSARGKGLGQRLFRGALAWLRDQGCDYVDSGYATKNHISAKLHMKAGFGSAYEEVTLHHWFT